MDSNCISARCAVKVHQDGTVGVPFLVSVYRDVLWEKTTIRI